MICIAGGPAQIGADDQRANEKPGHQVTISTFYIDRNEITNAEYEACVKAKVCPKRILPDRTFLGPKQPAVPVTWSAAEIYCRWVGKRLPTEAEWEKVARGGTEGRLYPWGNEPPSCDRAQTQGCTPNTTKPVGSFPAGAYGVNDMAGNGYEWVNDWASPCYGGCPRSCGDNCQGLDPAGPCSGAPKCKNFKYRVLKGGSWRWPADQARGSWRRFEKPASGAHRLSARCASSWSNLSNWPPLSFTKKASKPADPKPPTPAQLALFRNVVEDTDVSKIPACKKSGESSLNCRDPNSYVTTNEPNHHVWFPYIENLGGAYVGLGSDQSYSFIAAARSRWAWIFDYDPTVVRLHHVLREAILAADTPAKFVAQFSATGISKLKDLLPRNVPAEERRKMVGLLTSTRKMFYHTYKTAMKPHPETTRFGWLRNPDHYRYIRLMYQQGRIIAIKGNLLTDKALPSFGRAAKAMKMPIRIFYTSNADDFWDLTPQFRANILAMPFDERSVALRTVYPRYGKRTKKLPWRYIVQWGLDLQRKIRRPGWKRVWWFDHYEGRKDPARPVYTVRLPGVTARN